MAKKFYTNFRYASRYYRNVLLFIICTGLISQLPSSQKFFSLIKVQQFNQFSFTLRSMTQVYTLLSGIVVALLFIAFFSGIEIAFISANRLSIELKKKQGKTSGLIMSHFMEQPSR